MRPRRQSPQARISDQTCSCSSRFRRNIDSSHARLLHALSRQSCPNYRCGRSCDFRRPVSNTAVLGRACIQRCRPRLYDHPGRLLSPTRHEGAGVMISRRTLLYSAALLPTAMMAQSVLAAGTFEPRRSDEMGVQVIDSASSSWDFDVVMDTHIKTLSDDLGKISELLVAGRASAPLGWSGDAAGGHHRKAVLGFSRPDETPKSFELRMTGVGGSGARSFKWDAK